MNPSGIWSSAGGRRFSLALLTLASINAMLWWERMSDAIYRDILIAVVAVYVAGNVVQKVKAPEGHTDAG